MPFDKLPNYRFGLDHKTFINFGKQVRGNTSEMIPIAVGIEQVQDLESEWSMIDTPQPLSKAHINFCGETPTFQFRYKEKIGKTCNIPRHALKQIGNYLQQKGISGRNVNPYQLTEALCIQDDQYRQICTVAWSKMMDQMNNKELLFRSKVIDGIRTITSVQSMAYAPIRDSELLLKLQSQNPDLYFVATTISSISSNYRLIENGEITLNTPVKMYDIHNSDGGLRELVAFLKYFILKCTNGMFSTTTQDSFSNRHYGDRDVIAQRFGTAIEDFSQVDDGFNDDYMKARQTEIDNLWATMQHRLTGKLTKGQLDNLNVAFNSNLISSDVGTLGHAVDALTLSAQAENPHNRHMLEVNATHFMQDVFADLSAGKQLIPEEVLENMSV